MPKAYFLTSIIDITYVLSNDYCYVNKRSYISNCRYRKFLFIKDYLTQKHPTKIVVPLKT